MLLTYAVLTQPDPLQAGSAAALTLVVSNGGRVAVTCTSVTITLAVGTNAKDLVADASGIVSEPPAGWTCAQTGNQLVLTPETPAAGEIGGVGLAFVFSGLKLNAQPGTSAIAIGELASSPSQPQPAERSTSLDVTKFPAEFALSELTATPTEVSAAGSGGSVTLMWSGSPATYMLWYDPDGQGQRSVGVGKTGPYPVTGLTNRAGVTFTLTATLTVPGQDTRVTVLRQVVVAVSLAPPVIAAFTGTLRNGGTRRPVLTLRWAVSGVDSCFLDVNGTQQALPAASSMTITPTPTTPLAGAYTLSASNASGAVSSTLDVHWAPGPPPIVWSLGNVQCVVMAPDGRYAYVSCMDGVLTIDLLALGNVQMVPLPNGAGAALAVAPDGRTLYVLDAFALGFQPQRSFQGNVFSALPARTFGPPDSPNISLRFGELPYTGIAVTPDGFQLFISGNMYRMIAAYSLPWGGADGTIAIGRDSVSTLAVSPDGRFLFCWVTGTASTTGSSWIEVLDTGTRASAGPEITAPGAVIAVAFAPDATTAYVLFAGEAGSSAIAALDLMTHAWLGSPVATGHAASSLAVSFDGSRVLAGGPGTVDVFTTNPLARAASYGTPIAPVGDTNAAGGGVGITPDGVVIVAGAFPTPDAVSLLLPASVTGGVPSGR